MQISPSSSLPKISLPHSSFLDLSRTPHRIFPPYHKQSHTISFVIPSASLNINTLSILIFIDFQFHAHSRASLTLTFSPNHLHLAPHPSESSPSFPRLPLNQSPRASRSYSFPPPRILSLPPFHPSTSSSAISNVVSGVRHFFLFNFLSTPSLCVAPFHG